MRFVTLLVQYADAVEFLLLIISQSTNYNLLCAARYVIQVKQRCVGLIANTSIGVDASLFLSGVVKIKLNSQHISF